MWRLRRPFPALPRLACPAICVLLQLALACLSPLHRLLFTLGTRPHTGCLFRLEKSWISTAGAAGRYLARVVCFLLGTNIMQYSGSVSRRGRLNSTKFSLNSISCSPSNQTKWGVFRLKCFVRGVRFVRIFFLSIFGPSVHLVKCAVLTLVWSRCRGMGRRVVEMGMSR